MRNVTHQRVRSFTAIAGLCFAVVLVLLQLGFLGAVAITATNVYNRLAFDIALVSPEYEQFYNPSSFPRSRLWQAKSIAGVVDAKPLWTTMGLWRCPPKPLDPSSTSLFDRIPVVSKPPRGVIRRGLCIIGVDLDENPFRGKLGKAIDAAASRLRVRRTVILDRLSHPDFGWAVRNEFNGWELNNQEVSIVDGYELGSGFAADGSVICSEENFVRFEPMANELEVNIGLVSLADSGADIEELVEEMNRRLPPDVIALTRDQLDDRERYYWVRNTATGDLFGFGVFVALCVGCVVIYQVLSADVISRLPEYATLKAIGYSNLYLTSVILKQATIYAIASCIPAVAIAAVLYQITAALANIPMELTWQNILFVFLASLTTCMGSALLTVRRVRTADPAELFR
ncbi:FtsX-like permease family protein [Kolteria novifilia]